MIGDFPGDDDIDIDRVLRGDRVADRPKPRIAEVVSLRPKLNGTPKQNRSRKTLPPLDFADITATGVIRPTCSNTRTAIEKLEVRCEYDEFHDKLLIGGQPVGQYAGELSDHACVYLRKMIDEKFAFDPGRNPMHDACLQLCLENRFDPIVDYLNGLEWDGIELEGLRSQNVGLKSGHCRRPDSPAAFSESMPGYLRRTSNPASSSLETE